MDVTVVINVLRGPPGSETVGPRHRPSDGNTAAALHGAEERDKILRWRYRPKAVCACFWIRFLWPWNLCWTLVSHSVSFVDYLIYYGDSYSTPHLQVPLSLHMLTDLLKHFFLKELDLVD
jgi:hypothetical protein